MVKKKILFICGSVNQTTMMHRISGYLPEYDCFFTPFYCDGIYRLMQKMGILDFTIIGGQNRRNTEKYFERHGLRVDYAGETNDYDLFVTCTDLLVQKNTRGKNLILVQEGMTDPENFWFYLVKYFGFLGLPRWIASTSTTGMSDAYVKFCVASDGYRRHFARKGCREEKLAVTGIPNFDNAEEFTQNEFPHRDYVLVATTDTRENFKKDDRREFIERAKSIAGDRPMIFKLHPNEDPVRSTSEIQRYAPGAMVFSTGNTSHMIANCHTLVTQFSTVVYLGLALGKKVHSYFNLDELKELMPIQNGGTSARNIAEVCREYL